MSRTEDRVREALRWRVGDPVVRAMPPGTVGRVRRRRAGTAAIVALATSAALLVVSIAYVSLAPADRRQQGGLDPAADGYTSPLEEVPPGWPTVDVHDPGDTTIPLSVREGLPDAARLLVWGTVDGSDFELVGWDGASGPCLAFVELPTLDGADLSGTTCARTSPGAVPSERDVRAVTARVDSNRPFWPTFGFVSERARIVYAWGGLEQGMFRIPLLDDAETPGVRAFAFFPPTDAPTLEIYGRAQQLARADHCSSVDAACEMTVQQLVPIGTDPPGHFDLAPGEWPVVTFGGNFTPYVDHEVNANGVLDPGVVGDKAVVAYGTVEGVPWSVTGFNVRSEGEIVPSGQLFLGAFGALGGEWLGELRSDESPHPGYLSGGFTTVNSEISYLEGLVSPQVSAVRVLLENGDERYPELFRGPTGVDAKYFVLFVPLQATGRVYALDESGSVLSQLCLRHMFELPPGGDPCAT
jgi:hypothetical protein